MADHQQCTHHFTMAWRDAQNGLVWRSSGPPRAPPIKLVPLSASVGAPSSHSMRVPVRVSLENNNKCNLALPKGTLSPSLVVTVCVFAPRWIDSEGGWYVPIEETRGLLKHFLVSAPPSRLLSRQGRTFVDVPLLAHLLQEVCFGHHISLDKTVLEMLEICRKIYSGSSMPPWPTIASSLMMIFAVDHCTQFIDIPLGGEVSLNVCTQQAGFVSGQIDALLKFKAYHCA